jgi:hypothetical protein
MSRTDLAWLAVAAYALHIMEERILDWLGSARKSLDLTMEQENYRVVEGVFLVLGVVAAMVASTMPLIALSFAAFLLINAIFFHFWPMARSGGQFSPGAITSVLFLIIAWYQYTLTPLQPRDYIASLIIGGAVIFSPIALLKMREYPLFSGSGSAPAPAAKARRGRK